MCRISLLVFLYWRAFTTTVYHTNVTLIHDFLNYSLTRSILCYFQVEMKLNAMKNIDYSFQGSRECDFIEKILQVSYVRVVCLPHYSLFFCFHDAQLSGLLLVNSCQRVLQCYMFVCLFVWILSHHNVLLVVIYTHSEIISFLNRYNVLFPSITTTTVLQRPGPRGIRRRVRPVWQVSCVLVVFDCVSDVLLCYGAVVFRYTMCSMLWYWLPPRNLV